MTLLSLLPACGHLPDGGSDEKTTVALEARPNGDAPSYSALTRQETETTLKRLQAMRQLQQGQKTYQGPMRHIWDRILANSQIQYENNLRIEKQATMLLRKPDYLHRVSVRAEPYIYFILEEIDKRRLPAELALLPVIESAYRPTARSRSRAVGLWQFIPSTSRHLGMKTNWWYDARRDVVTSTQQALDYLAMINKKFDGDWLLTLAAYNAGHGRVSRAIKRNKKLGKPTDYWNLKLPRETRDYVPRFLAASRMFSRPDEYAIKLHSVSNKPHFAEANIQSQLDLNVAAEIAGMNPGELRRYNPGFLRWATAPEGPHRLLLPIAKVADFHRKLAKLSDEDRLRWVHHTVKRGDTLTEIAFKYGVAVSMLKKTNKLKKSLIHPGDNILVPLSSKSVDSKKSSAKRPLSQDKDFYIVRNGDTLWEIARRHNMKLSLLMSMNSMNKKTVLRPGQKIRIRQQTASAKLAQNQS